MKYRFKIAVKFSCLCFAVLLICCDVNHDQIGIDSTESKRKDVPKHMELEPIKPIYIPEFIDNEKVALGDSLFHEVLLSKTNTISCASCHQVRNQGGGTDNLPVSVGVEGNLGNINSPTVLNATLNFKQFWDGRAKDLTEQIDGPVHNPKEMGSSWEEVVLKISNVAAYKTAFKANYSDGVTSENIKDAIVQYENTLITPSRFDQYLLGDTNAITFKEKQGYKLFKKYGCSSCHQGQNVGGNMFQKIGVSENYFVNKKVLNKVDYGRFNETGREEDKFYFKVPSLRNVALTSPYFHDASVQKLEDAIKTMARVQIGREIPPNEIMLIRDFLNSLTGINLEKEHAEE